MIWKNTSRKIPGEVSWIGNIILRFTTGTSARFRGTDVHLVEFGVGHGGSLQMWKQYFGSRARIFGVDINPDCKNLEREQIEIFIGDQEDRRFLKYLAKQIPRIDILIDDGGHTMPQQIKTFEELFPHVDEKGLYLCEDLHTSYWPEFGGGHKEARHFHRGTARILLITSMPGIPLSQEG